MLETTDLSLSPGHSVVQVTLWKGGPSQKAPPFRGAGLVQLRVRRCQPRPHRALHSDHSVQEDQPPLTEGGREKERSWQLTFKNNDIFTIFVYSLMIQSRMINQ